MTDSAILMHATLLMDVMCDNQHWPLTNVDLYRTCKQLYSIWSTELRQRMTKQMVAVHAAEHIPSAKGNYIPMLMWGDISLYLAQFITTLQNIQYVGDLSGLADAMIRFARHSIYAFSQEGH